jgi:16S rRNA (cytosine1402-N4)-methyltransferase
MEFKHKPVLLNQVVSGLNIRPDGVYLDCTVGGAGHSAEIAKQLGKNGMLFCVDKDQQALDASAKKLQQFDNVKFIKSDYNFLQDKLIGLEFDGILIDLGVSSHQIDTPERGFSFLHDGPLDMRMDQTQELTAFDVVNTYSKQQLEKILFEYGEEFNAKIIVRAILEHRAQNPIRTTKQLVDIIENCLPAKFKFRGASKKTFQAIRIEVNGELDRLNKTLEFLVSKLKKGGRLAVITFHSLEDRIVKQTFSSLATSCVCPPHTPICICGKKQIVSLVNKKPISASEQELADNPRARSAHLRICQKC